MKVVYSENYKELFERAQTLLAESSIKDDDDGDILIQDLPSYYRWLDIIEQVGGPEFLRIPLEEDCFEIDTNTRKIIKPVVIDNEEWVIGVKDDHLAEVLWFHVDRFFDGQDLAICFPIEGEAIQQGQTYIQWKNKTGQGLDPVQHVQIDENNIYFGWYLRSNDGVLNTSGDLTFSVRFQYHKGGTEFGPDFNTDVLFSFNTLPVTCKILTNLTESMGANIGSIKDLNVENITLQGSTRPRFSGVFDSTKGPKAYIGTDLNEYIDLVDGEATLAIVADGSGTLHYRWYKDGSLIENATSDTCTVNSIGIYSVQVGNEYETGKTRWTDSNPCEVPAASELKFAENGNILGQGYANGVTELSVVVEREPDSFGRTDKGTISYTWYRDALEGEYFDDDPTKTTEEIATTEKYTPLDGEVGYYYVEVINSHNADSSEILRSEKCIMKAPAATPSSVVITFNQATKKFVADVEILHKNDLYYTWYELKGHSDGPTLGKNVYEVKEPGTYFCRVYQNVYPGYPNETVSSEPQTSNLVEVTSDMLK